VVLVNRGITNECIVANLLANAFLVVEGGGRSQTPMGPVSRTLVSQVHGTGRRACDPYQRACELLLEQAIDGKCIWCTDEDLPVGNRGNAELHIASQVIPATILIAIVKLCPQVGRIISMQDRPRINCP
jgi:hypothetical protein